MLLTKELTLDLDLLLSFYPLFAFMTSQAYHPPYTFLSQEGSPGRHHLFHNDGPTSALSVYRAIKCSYIYISW